MHIEIQVAINYVMLQLYEKLPRRRVNIFGEELEKALKDKFEGHWYPDAPEKGSGYRCLKVGRIIDPPDPLLEKAAYDSGLEVHDILEHLPKELNIWIDPGEVSFRIGDKGPTEILYSTDASDHSDNEVARTFNPEAKCFRPTNDLSAVGVGITAASAFNPLVIAKPASPPVSGGSLSPVSNGLQKCCSPQQQQQQQQHQQQPLKQQNYKNGKAITPSSMNCFAPRTQTPTFTTATFAQTKFGSTKLKTNSKRTNRMSPTEFANYIKHKAQMQQHMQMQQHGGGQQQQQQQNTATISLHMRQPFGSGSSGGSGDGSFYNSINGNGSGGNGSGNNVTTANNSQNHFANYRNVTAAATPMDSSTFAAIDSLNRFSTYMDGGDGGGGNSPPFFNHTLAPLSPLGIGSSPSSTTTTTTSSTGQNLSAKGNQEKHYLESFNFALNSPGPSSPYQHLLLAN